MIFRIKSTNLVKFFPEEKEDRDLSLEWMQMSNVPLSRSCIAALWIDSRLCIFSFAKTQFVFRWKLSSASPCFIRKIWCPYGEGLELSSSLWTVHNSLIKLSLQIIALQICFTVVQSYLQIQINSLCNLYCP